MIKKTTKPKKALDIILTRSRSHLLVLLSSLWGITVQGVMSNVSGPREMWCACKRYFDSKF